MSLSKFWDAYWKKDAQDKLGWRLDYNQKFRGDIYATHGLGPIAQVLNIHRGDKMKTLVAMDTKSVNGKKQVEKMTGEPVMSSVMVTKRLPLSAQRTGKSSKYTIT